MAVQLESVRETQKSFDPYKQKTLKKSVSLSGVGLFTAENSTLTLHPLEANSGVFFLRSDLKESPRISGDLDHVVSTPRCTILGNDFFTIHTVEHLLSAFKGMGINNVLVELNGPEIPIIDGSAQPFVELILQGGIRELDAERKVLSIKSPISWSQGDVHLVALPSSEMRISYTLHFPESKILRSQYLSAVVDSFYYATEIAPCRTFCLYEEITPFIENGLIKAGGLDNAVIIKNDVVINPEGIRFSNEMVRHKILDLIGDLSLIPVDFAAHIIAIRSGHASNIAFAKALHKHIKMENA